VPVLIVIALVLVLVQPWLARRLAARRAAAAAAAVPSGGGQVEPAEPGAGERRDGKLLWLGILGTGAYGGYFGAAQGVLLLGLMGVTLPEPLQRINAVKNVLAMLANLVAGIIFVFVAHVSWVAVALIAVGSAIGGVLGARVGRKLSPTMLRAVIVVIGLVALGKLLFT
jgi:uncharacterized membrane protein YfcA